MRDGTPAQRPQAPWWAWLAACGMVALACGLLVAVAVRPGQMLEAAAAARGMERYDPAVLVLGSSLADADLDVDVLARAAGVPSERVVKLVVNDSSLPHWYLALRNSVLAAGGRPTRVIVPTTVGQLLQGTLRDDVDRRQYATSLVGDEPPEALRPLGGGPGTRAWTRLRARGTHDLESLVFRLQQSAVALAWGLPMEEAEERLRRAEDVYIALDPDAVEASGADGIGALLHQLDRYNDVDPPEDTLLPALVDLTRAHGAKLAVVHVPVAPWNGVSDDVDEDVLDRLAPWFDARGVVWVDARGFVEAEAEWRDMLHMTEATARPFTQRVAEALADQGFWDEADAP